MYPTSLNVKPDAEGDVILVTGADQVEIRVSAKVLSLASDVFAALLGPNFAEGSTMTSNCEPRRITLPEDDSAAMAYACQALHFADNVQGDMKLEFLVKIATLVDKYGLNSALRAWGEAWLRSCKPAKHVHHARMQHMWCAAVFDCHRHFYKDSINLLLYCVWLKDPKSLTIIEEEGRLPWQLFAGIEVERGKILRSIVETVDGCIQSASKHSANTTLHTIFDLQDAKLWPTTKVMSQHDMQATLSAPDNLLPCTRSEMCTCNEVKKAGRLKACIGAVKLQGLCLQCFRRGKISIAQGNCAAAEASECIETQPKADPVTTAEM